MTPGAGGARPEVHLVRIGSVDPAVIEYLSLALADGLSFGCRIREGTIDPLPAFDERRGQFRADEILARIAALEVGDGAKVLGVADVDLFLPVLTFVYGQAQVRSRAALLSVHRLRQEFYGLPPDEDRFLERCEKEALHELGHTFGLVHCSRWDCLMHFSNSIEEVDLKGRGFCRRCARQLR